MIGSNIEEREVHVKISRVCDGCSAESKIHKAARKCMKEVRSITEECEKGKSLFTCAMKAQHKLEEHEKHENQETEENEEAEEDKESELSKYN